MYMYAKNSLWRYAVLQCIWVILNMSCLSGSESRALMGSFFEVHLQKSAYTYTMHSAHNVHVQCTYTNTHYMYMHVHMYMYMYLQCWVCTYTVCKCTSCTYIHWVWGYWAALHLELSIYRQRESGKCEKAHTVYCTCITHTQVYTHVHVHVHFVHIVVCLTELYQKLLVHVHVHVYIHKHTYTHKCSHTYMHSISSLTFRHLSAGPPASTSHTTAGNLVPAPPSTEKPNVPFGLVAVRCRSNTTLFISITILTCGANYSSVIKVCALPSLCWPTAESFLSITHTKHMYIVHVHCTLCTPCMWHITWGRSCYIYRTLSSWRLHRV